MTFDAPQHLVHSMKNMILVLCGLMVFASNSFANCTFTLGSVAPAADAEDSYNYYSGEGVELLVAEAMKARGYLRVTDDSADFTLDAVYGWSRGYYVYTTKPYATVSLIYNYGSPGTEAVKLTSEAPFAGFMSELNNLRTREQLKKAILELPTCASLKQ